MKLLPRPPTTNAEDVQNADDEATVGGSRQQSCYERLQVADVNPKVAMRESCCRPVDTTTAVDSGRISEHRRQDRDFRPVSRKTRYQEQSCCRPGR
jgi:hypothetical protein